MRYRKRFRVLGFAATAIAAMALLVLRADAAPAAFDCTSTVSNRTISGAVRVPSGASCRLDNVHVTGQVFVKSGGALGTRNGTQIDQGISATSANYVQINDSTVTGNITIGNTSTQLELKNTICNSTINGSLFIRDSDSTTQWSVGDEPPDDFCNGGNTFNGNVKLERNHANFNFANNTVNGSVRFNDNTQTLAEEVEYDVSGNTISGVLQCTGNNPAPEIDEPNTVSGSTTGQCIVP
jgi:hypothetical protein